MNTRTTERSNPQVLVVGAGPVGLMAGLCLAQQGIDVRIVDQQPAAHARSFPVVLHPASLRLLDRVGLSAALFWRGRPVTRLAVYADYERRAVLDIPQASQAMPFALTLPQDILRQALLNALARHGVEVEWNTRLEALQQDNGAAWGRLVVEMPELSGSRSVAVGAFEAEFVIGADGYESTVRDALHVPLVEYGGLESYVFFDAPSRRAGSEAQLSMSEDFVNTVYPLQGDCARFSFQINRGLGHALDVRSLHELIQSRLPWYAEEPSECEWAGVAEFRHALAASFGQGRIWLAGEAAHLTGPLGVQSLNVGLAEAAELSQLIQEQLGRPLQPGFAQSYTTHRRQQWLELLGAEERPALSSRTPGWARRYSSRLLSCLPAAEQELDDLLDQLRLTPSSGRPLEGATRT